jgi:dihydroxyacetone kinase-like predicted kinase
MFLLHAPPGGSLDLDGLRQYLEAIGDSVLVAGDAKALKVHVHNDRPDLVIARGLSLGSLSRISVENLDAQAREIRESRAAEFTGAVAPEASASGAPPAAEGSIVAGRNGTTAGSGNGSGPGAGEEIPLAVVAVTAGDGLAAIFRDFGVSRVVLGGQAANPSTGELLEAVRELPAREVLVLPNNPNVFLAARQVAQMADRPVEVVATRNAAEGFAALLALDPTKDASANAAEMTAAGRAIQSLSVTDAVRDATIGGRKVRRGQTIVLDPDDGLVAVDDDPATAIVAGLKALESGFELLTVYYGEGADLDGAEALVRRVRDALPGVDVEIVHGGQPYYQYLISAE